MPPAEWWNVARFARSQGDLHQEANVHACDPDGRTCTHVRR